MIRTLCSPALLLAALAACGGADSADPADSDPRVGDTALHDSDAPGDDTDDDTNDDTVAGGEDTDGAEPAALTSPAEAEDLDPDEGAVRFALTAAPHTHAIDLGDETLTVEGYAYNGQTPGPTLRAILGQEVTVALTNDLESATTIHWHGVDVPYAMDGVTWQADPVEPGETFTYTFTPPRAGTFWYHPHFNSDDQVSGGLYGVLVVEDPAEPAADVEIVAVIDDWSPAGADLGDEHLEPEGPWTVNGLVSPALTVSGGQRVRARLLNAAGAGYAHLQWPGMRQIAGDQGLLPAPLAPASLLLAPGDRAEVEWLIGEEGFEVLDRPYTHRGGETRGEPATLLQVAVDAPAAAPAPLELPWPGGEISEDPPYADVVWVFSGSPEEGVWMMNGEVFPEVTIPEVSLGETLIVEIRNLSPTEHPFHLHGMAFEVLSVDGAPPAQRTVEDTLNVGIYQTVRLKVIADNPGDWMAHCHILPHAEGGMMSVLRVLDP